MEKKVTVRYAADLVEGKDYDIVSYLVVDKTNQFQTIESFFSVNQLDLIQPNISLAEFEKVLKIHCLKNRDREDFKYNKKTDMVKMPVYFYQLNNLPLDFDLLISLGFGLVRMLSDEEKGNFCFYDILYFRNAFYSEEDDWDDPLIGDTAIRLMIYFSLKDPKYVNDSLANILNMNEEYLKLMCLCNVDKIIKKLKIIYREKEQI